MDYGVIYGTDAGYLPVVCFSIKSFVEAGVELPEFLILVTDDTPSAELERAESYLRRFGVRWTFFPTSLEAMRGTASSDYLPHAAYLRLVAVEKTPERLERLLYLDGDTRVMPGVPSPLGVDLAGQPIGAVHDALAILAFWPGFQQDLGLVDGDSYFNSGVMMIDRQEWLRRECGRRVLEFARSWPERCRTADQCALNAVLRSEWTAIDPRWNNIVAYWDQFPPTLFESDRRPAGFVEHFASERPWKKLRYSGLIEHNRWYAETAADSPWPEYVERASALRVAEIRWRQARQALRTTAYQALGRFWPSALGERGRWTNRGVRLLRSCLEQNDPWAADA